MSSILPDSLTRTQPQLDLTVQPVAPTKDVTEALSRLATGQRVLAEILTSLPNGTYRAVINQRDMVLALPFSAKTGDTLELEVVNTEGKVAFAVVPAAKPTSGAEASTTTSLSPAGRLISQLLGGEGAQGTPAKPAVLAGGQSVTSAPPGSGATLAPALAKAVGESGLFYEAHQARWLDGRLPLQELAREPQNRQPLPGYLPASRSLADAPERPAGLGQPAPIATPPATSATTLLGRDALATANGGSATGSQDKTTTFAAPLALSRELAPLVQQQLQALATQQAVWQGQVWPGQAMKWEIIEEEEHSRAGGEEPPTAPVWRTRLHLDMPGIGAVDAELKLSGNAVEARIVAPHAAAMLRKGEPRLRQLMDAAGLSLGTTRISAHD